MPDQADVVVPALPVPTTVVVSTLTPVVTVVVADVGQPGPPGPAGPSGGVALAAHVLDTAPHPAYDDLPSLALIFENGLV